MLNRNNIILNDILIDRAYNEYYLKQLRAVCILEATIPKMIDLSQQVLRQIGMLSLQEPPATEDIAQLTECFHGVVEEIVAHQSWLKNLKINMEREEINYKRLKEGDFYTPQYAPFPKRTFASHSSLAELGNEKNPRLKTPITRANPLKEGDFYTPQYALFPKRTFAPHSSLAELGNEENPRLETPITRANPHLF